MSLLKKVTGSTRLRKSIPTPVFRPWTDEFGRYVSKHKENPISFLACFLQEMLLPFVLPILLVKVRKKVLCVYYIVFPFAKCVV